MATTELPTSSDQIITRFNQLRKAQERRNSELITRAEEAERASRREVVGKAADYTVESIVTGLAELQLEFSTELDTISDRLQSESDKLELLQRAITIESGRLTNLRDIQVAAEALALLNREQALEREAFETRMIEERAALAKTRETVRADWAEEAVSHDAAVVAFETQRARDRAQAEEAYTYETARKRKRDADDYTNRKLALERKLAETAAQKEADWASREAYLAANEEKIVGLRARVAELPGELDKAVKDARAKAIRDTNEDAEIEAELRQKEHESDLKVFALRIETLESTIVKQTEQTLLLTEQLQVAANQSQDLAVKAIEGSARPRS